MKEIESILKQADIHPTANRISIYRAISSMNTAFSLAEVSDILETIDTSNVFRTLTLFLQKQLIHEVDDGSGSRKYCLCRCDAQHHNSHVHFVCLSCHKTFCINDLETPTIAMPSSFSVTETSIVLKGYCPQCKPKSPRS